MPAMGSLNNIQVKSTFTEEGASAKTLNRPVMRAMLEYLEEHKREVDYLVTYQTDRLKRNTGGFIQLTHRLAKMGIEY